METQATEWSRSKKIVIFSIVGTVLFLSIVAAFIPETREFVTTITKVLLGSIEPITKI